MAKPGSINQELFEEFLDCSVKLTVRGKKVQGVLYGLSKQDSGLVLTIGAQNQGPRPVYESVEENDIDEAFGESTDGYVRLFPLEGLPTVNADGSEPEDDGTEVPPPNDDGASSAEQKPEEASTGDLSGQNFEPAAPGNPMTSEVANTAQAEAAERSKEKRGRK